MNYIIMIKKYIFFLLQLFCLFLGAGYMDQVLQRFDYFTYH